MDSEADEVARGLATAGLQAGDRVMLPIDNSNAVETATATIANIPERASGVEFDALWLTSDMPRARTVLPDQRSYDLAADAVILGTSETTGAIEGVVNSHPDLMHLFGDGHLEKHHNSTLHALPFTSSVGMHGELLLPLVGGATCFTQLKFDPTAFMQLVAEKQPTTSWFTPTMLRPILDHFEVASSDFSRVRQIPTGTAPLPQNSIARALRFSPRVQMWYSYGMSEGGTGVSTKSRNSLLKPGCVGPMPVHMQIRKEAGQPVDGKIYGRAAHPRRYWNDPKRSRRGLVDGWTGTGDLGFVNPDDDLINSGQLKDIIIRGGFNLSPVEVENVLHAHAAVKDAAVVGIAHDVLGEDVAAAVTLNNSAAVTVEALQEWCKARLSTNKAPRTIVFLAELSLNANAKVLKPKFKPLLEQADVKRRGTGQPVKEYAA